jgi:uncharacterized protein
MILNKIMPRLILAASLLFAAVWPASAQDNAIPERPNPPRLVNILAAPANAMLSATEADALERKLDDFSSQTSNQICVVITDDLKGMDPSDYATRLIRKWTVGQQKLNNGVVILIKPRIGTEKGETFIATGYGLEGAIPDITCNKIVTHELLPNFREGNYAGGIDAAVNVLMALAKGEYNTADYDKRILKGKGSSGIGRMLPALIIIVVLFFIFMSRGGGSSGAAMGGFWIGSGGFGGGGFGGGGGGGGGGFGGFGGGSGGGGGAGGSW